MMRPLKGLSKVKKTLADGSTIYYCYAWRGGPLFKNGERYTYSAGRRLPAASFLTLRTTTDATRTPRRYTA